MATPNYKGQGQPAVSNGGWLGSLLGASAPAYAGAGQPASRSSGYLSGAPAYKPAPPPAPKPATPTTATASDEGNPTTTFAIVIPRQVIEEE